MIQNNNENHLMSKITPPRVVYGNIGCSSHKSCNVSGGAHFCARRLFLFLIALILAGAFVSGYRAGRRAAHAGMVWVDDIPSLYVPIFYNADSLNRYMDIAFRQKEEDPEAFAIVGTAAYNLRVFDKAALDTLPAVPLEDADMLLLGAAWKGYAPAFTVIHYLDQLDLWHHSIPDNEPTIFPGSPAKGDPDYVLMIVKK